MKELCSTSASRKGAGLEICGFSPDFHRYFLMNFEILQKGRFLQTMSIGTVILYCAIAFVAALLIGGVIAFFIGVAYRKRVAESEIGSAEDQAKKIINEAYRTAEAKKKELLIEAKEEVH